MIGLLAVLLFISALVISISGVYSYCKSKADQLIFVLENYKQEIGYYPKTLDGSNPSAYFAKLKYHYLEDKTTIESLTEETGSSAFYMIMKVNIGETTVGMINKYSISIL